MLRFHHSVFIVLLTLGIFSIPVHAEFSRETRIGLAVTGALGVALHAVSAAASFQSKYEISPFEGDKQRPDQESATVTHGLAAAFTLAAAATLASTPLAIVPLAGFGMACAFMAMGSTALSFHKDEYLRDHPWHVASFATGIASTLTSMGLFLGSYLSNPPN